MDPLVWKEPVLFFAAGVLFTILVYRTRLFLRLNHSRYQKVWNQFAAENGLELTSPSLLEIKAAKPAQIVGRFRNREMVIHADTTGRIGFWHAVLNIQMGVDNPSSVRLPVGAFLHIRPHPGMYDPLYRLQIMMGRKEPEGAQIGGRFLMQSIPVNLGNHLNALHFIDSVLAAPGMNSLVIERGKLRFTSVGLPGDAAAMETLVNDVCDLAERFERFVRNWV